MGNLWVFLNLFPLFISKNSNSILRSIFIFSLCCFPAAPSADKPSGIWDQKAARLVAVSWRGMMPFSIIGFIIRVVVIWTYWQAKQNMGPKSVRLAIVSLTEMRALLSLALSVSPYTDRVPSITNWYHHTDSVLQNSNHYTDPVHHVTHSWANWISLWLFSVVVVIALCCSCYCHEMICLTVLGFGKTNMIRVRRRWQTNSKV